MSEKRTCKASVYDKDTEYSRPCMRKVGPNNIYCWQHSNAVNRTYGNHTLRQGIRRLADGR